MKYLRPVLFLVIWTSAQLSFGQLNMEMGVKAGFNYTNLDLSTVGRLAAIDYYHWNPSYHLGVYAKIRLPKKYNLNKFAIQPELVLSRQGQNFTTSNTRNLLTSLYYVNVPIMIKYHVLGGLNVQAGPQIGVMAFSRGDLLRITTTTSSGGYIYGPPLSNQSLSLYTNKIDFSLAFGAGLDLPFGGSLTVRYNVGITNVNKFTNANSSNQPMDANGNVITPSVSTTYARNQVFQVSLGYRIKKSK